MKRNLVILLISLTVSSIAWSMSVMPKETAIRLDGALFEVSNTLVAVRIAAYATTNTTSPEIAADFRKTAQSVARLADVWTIAGSNANVSLAQVQGHEQKWFDMAYGFIRRYWIAIIIILLVGWIVGLFHRRVVFNK